MNAGKLRERLRFERPKRQRNELGEATLRYSHPADKFSHSFGAWAEVKAGSGDETTSNGSTTKRQTYAIRIRFNARLIDPVKPNVFNDEAGGADAWRIVYRGRVLEIASMVPDDRRTEINIVAHEQIGQMAQVTL